MDQNGAYIVLDPTEGAVLSESGGRMAERLSTLDGKVLGVVNNGKLNSDVFLRSILKLVQKKYALKDVIWIDKTNPSLPVTDAMLEQLKASQAVISGMGD
jgi:hypothetical protein